MLPSAHPRVHNTNGKSLGAAVSAQLTAKSLYRPTLQWATLSPKIAPYHAGVWIPDPSFMIPWAHPCAQPKRHLDRFSRFCTDDHRVSLYFTIGRHFPRQHCLFPLRDLDSHPIHGSLGQPESSTQTASRSVQPFLRGSLV